MAVPPPKFIIQSLVSLGPKRKKKCTVADNCFPPAKDLRLSFLCAPSAWQWGAPRCSVSCFMDEDVTEAREPDSSITQHCYSCTTKDRLTGRMEIFKGGTDTHSNLARCIKSSVLPDCLCVFVCLCLCVCACVSSVGPCGGWCWPAREKKRRRRGVEKPINGKITCVSAGVSLRTSHS